MKDETEGQANGPMSSSGSGATDGGDVGSEEHRKLVLKQQQQRYYLDMLLIDIVRHLGRNQCWFLK